MEIENYEPSDEGWGIVIGPLIRPEHRPQPKLEDEAGSSPAEHEDTDE